MMRPSKRRLNALELLALSPRHASDHPRNGFIGLGDANGLIRAGLAKRDDHRRVVITDNGLLAIMRFGGKGEAKDTRRQ